MMILGFQVANNLKYLQEGGENKGNSWRDTSPDPNSPHICPNSTSLTFQLNARYLSNAVFTLVTSLELKVKVCQNQSSISSDVKM